VRAGKGCVLDQVSTVSVQILRQSHRFPEMLENAALVVETANALEYKSAMKRYCLLHVTGSNLCMSLFNLFSKSLGLLLILLMFRGPENGSLDQSSGQYLGISDFCRTLLSIPWRPFASFIEAGNDFASEDSPVLHSYAVTWGHGAARSMLHELTTWSPSSSAAHARAPSTLAWRLTARNCQW
jgi:hypothetical protein